MLEEACLDLQGPNLSNRTSRNHQEKDLQTNRKMDKGHEQPAHRKANSKGLTHEKMVNFVFNSKQIYKIY